MSDQHLRSGVLILDYGSQYTLLIARRLRELRVYCEVWPCNDARLGPLCASGQAPAKGIILSGGPSSVAVEGAPALAGGLLDLQVPVLGICYGMQLLGQAFGATVGRGEQGEYGRTSVVVEQPLGPFLSFAGGTQLDVWMSHGDAVAAPPQGFVAVARSTNGLLAAMAHRERPLFGLQFHPEVAHTQGGEALLRSFAVEVCGIDASWNMGDFLTEQVTYLRERVGEDRVLCALSGGVDSSVVAALLARACPEQLTCLFVDTGLLRKGEREIVETTFREHFGVRLEVVDARARFMEVLRGVEDPEAKRKRIGETFIRVFEDACASLGEMRYLAQGTLYPDVIESVSVRGPSATIKSHHNVGGLPEDMRFELIEPLRELFKDEVRALGRQLGLPHEIVGRHPFPGPGLAVRILGALDEEKVATLQEADHIFISALHEFGLYDDIWQAFAVLIPVKTVGVMGDSRTYEWLCALRAVTSTDGMTADRAHIPHDVLGVISDRIINRVRRINRVVYDVSSKPPATIEWE